MNTICLGLARNRLLSPLAESGGRDSETNSLLGRIDSSAIFSINDLI